VSELDRHRVLHNRKIGDKTVIDRIRQLWAEEDGQDVAEYAVMLAVILVIVIGTVRLIGSNANTVFSQVGSSLSQ
jgi:pilus assembly protein Flp/PilA